MKIAIIQWNALIVTGQEAARIVMVDCLTATRAIIAIYVVHVANLMRLRKLTMSCNHLDDCSRCGGTVDYLEEMVENLEAKVNRLSQSSSSHSFDVTYEDFDDLSDEEKESVPDNGWGKEWAGYIRIRHDGKTLLLESDAIEPEDKNFHRDLSWIPDWLKKAYELGKEDAR